MVKELSSPGCDGVDVVNATIVVDVANGEELRDGTGNLSWCVSVECEQGQISDCESSTFVEHVENV